MTRTIIIGAGLGGLSSAVYLAKAGHHVQVFEKNDHFGGKMMDVKLGSYSFDFGPNTITMPHVFQDVIRTAGLDPNKEIPMIKLTDHTRNEFSDGTHFDFSTDYQTMRNELARVDPGNAKNLDRFLQDIEKLYQLSNKHFLHRTFNSWRNYLSLPLAGAFMQVKPHMSMASFFNKYFDHPHILQSLNRYSTYVGSNPYIAPATFAMIAHLEWNQGVFYTKGGNTRIAEAFVKSAKAAGVELYSNSKVTQLLTEGKEVTGVMLEDGSQHKADHVILNGDLLHALPRLLSEENRKEWSDKRINKMTASTSAFVIMAGLDRRFDKLKHHHVFFSSDYEREFRQLESGRYADDPTIYVCTSSKSDPSVSPDGDNLFILVNTPPISTGDPNYSKQTYRKLIFNRLKEFGLDIEDAIVEELLMAPEDIQDKFGAFKGSIYGPASNNRMQSFLRPFNQSSDFENLHFTGGSTHPGGGSPMVVLSGKNVAAAILGKLESIEI
ncbi:phytoene desaturase family protein [Thalassobacillus hwangdonensis]|uniref:4,4'-diaponeurosporene oxygenase n=1 Tax=Thalassobacillus hwangdonensis TaxID=546108 RepID=A0ABW3KYD0_9BACI